MPRSWVVGWDLTLGIATYRVRKESASVGAAQAATGPSPLSRQVRGMRRDDPQQSVQRNVVDAFATFVQRLDEVYCSSSAAAPAEFRERLDYWRSACGLPDAVHARMHKLRVWRNASEHHDQQWWAREGPRDADEAATFIAQLEASVAAL